MGAMTGFIKRLEETFSAAAFAEAGERDEALRMAGIPPCEAAAKAGIEDVFAAAAFAEAGCPDQAREILGLRTTRTIRFTSKSGGFLESIGLAGVPVVFGLAEI